MTENYTLIYKQLILKQRKLNSHNLKHSKSVAHKVLVNWLNCYDYVMQNTGCFETVIPNFIIPDSIYIIHELMCTTLVSVLLNDYYIHDI